MSQTPDRPDPREKKPDGSGPGGKKPKGMGGIFVIFLLILALFFVVSQSSEGSKKTLYDFRRLLYNGQLETVQVTRTNQLIGTYMEAGKLRRIETTFRTLPDAEREAIERIQAYKVDPRYEQRGIRGFLEDMEKGRITIDGRAWVVHETETRVAPSAAQNARAQQEPPRPEKIYLCAFVFQGNEHAYVRAPLIEGDANAQALQATVAKLQSKDIDVSTVAIGQDASYEVQAGESQLTMVLMSLLPWIILFGLFWFFIMRQMRSPGGSGGVLSFGRSRANRYNKEQKVKVSLADVQGMAEAKEEVAEVIEFLKNPGKFQKLGGRIPRGVLLVGPPGTGKTLLAKAIAGEADVPFFSISGSDFVEMFVGVGASRVRDLFKQARESSPCIVFLDEIDAVGRKRGTGMGGGHDEREQTLNAILVEMDGFDTSEGIILIGATNRPDVLDPALLRPGRFDRQVVIDMPDVQGREEILKVHAGKVKISRHVDWEKLARATPGFSGAELASLINEAAILAAMRGGSDVEMRDLEEARDRVRFGREKRTRKMLEEDRRVTAFHEAGHALVGARIPEVDPVHKVTIIARGMALGATMYLPDKDDYHMRRSKLLGMIAMSYGGRLAEDIVFGDISAGAQNDIQQATRIARTMVAEWGMSDEIGAINYAAQSDNDFLGREFRLGGEHSEETAKRIDSEVKKILDECYERAREILTADRAILDEIAEALLRYETISGEEVRAIVDGSSAAGLRPEPEKPSPPPVPTADEASEEERRKARDEGDELGLSGAEGFAT